MKILYLSILFFVFLSCKNTQPIIPSSKQFQNFDIRLDTINLFDKKRNRLVPVAYYQANPILIKQKIIILSHGYGQNKGGDYLEYSYLAEFLATKGYFVASIQHELSTDSLLPLTGIPQVVRRPFWERGVDNILFVINELRQSNKNLNINDITLIGHSNGGDMTALFPKKYPNIVKKIITLDHRRMSLPTIRGLKTLSLRSSDQVADEGVLPPEKELKKFDITIIKLPHTKHNDMDNEASPNQRKEINDYILNFLNK